MKKSKVHVQRHSVQRQPQGRFISFGTISKKLLQKLNSGFEQLPQDIIRYNCAERQSRFRRFSTFIFKKDSFIRSQEFAHRFNPRQEFHVSYADSPLEELDFDLDTVINELLLGICDSHEIAPTEFAFGVNQIRVTAMQGDNGSPAPGLHRDGYSLSYHLNIARDNVGGGESQISDTPYSEGIFERRILEPGEWIFFDDRTVYHTASELTQINPARASYRDMYILDFVTKSE